MEIKKVFGCGFIGTETEHKNNKDLCFNQLPKNNFNRHKKVVKCLYC